MLKLDENPLVFPPFEVCNIDPDGPSPASTAEREAHITSRVKKYLRQHSSAYSNRRQLHVDSDGESRYGLQMILGGPIMLTAPAAKVNSKLLARFAQRGPDSP